MKIDCGKGEGDKIKEYEKGESADDWAQHLFLNKSDDDLVVHLSV